MKYFVTAVFLFLLGSVGNAQYDMMTARESLQQAHDLAVQNHGGEASLLMVMTMRFPIPDFPEEQYLNRDGEAGIWAYAFHTKTDDMLAIVISLGGFVMEGDSQPDASQNGDTTAVLAGWVDSDQAMSAFISNGAGDFLDSRESARIEAFALTNSAGGPDAETQWALLCTSAEDSLECFMHAVTMEALDCHTLTDADLVPVAESVSVGAAYPQPATAGGFVTVPYTLDRAGELDVSVFDVLGREVGMVQSLRDEPGRHQVVVPGHLLSRPGTYLVRFSLEGEQAVRKIVVR